MAGSLGLRRVSPALALGVAWLTAILQMVCGLGAAPSNAAILAVLYATAAYGSRRINWLGLISAGAGSVVATLYTILFAKNSVQLVTFSNGLNGFARLVLGLGVYLALALGTLVLPWTLGQLTRMRRATRESRDARVVAEAERLRAEEIATIEQESNRIARDMHDVVAHSLAVVIAQADGARYARTRDPDAVDAALTTISTAAREALGDVRQLLGQLRHRQGDGPQPVLADLDRLVEQLRSAGLLVTTEQTGQPGQLGTPGQIAVYRIVQEALTNTLRHGATGEVVRFCRAWSAEGVTVRVSSPLRPGLAGPAVAGPAATGLTAVRSVVPAAGHGIAGMRERAALAGGWLTVDSAVDGRFLVTAFLPCRAAAPGDGAGEALISDTPISAESR